MAPRSTRAAVWIGAGSLMAVLAACRFDLPEPMASTDADAPACADGDDDNDGVCNAVDKCPGKIDGGDVDSDGTVDGCDDWPCGATKPNDPGDSMTDSDLPERGWGANNINIGNTRRLAVAPGQTFGVMFDWGIYIDCGQPPTMCRAQMEIGFGLTRTGCIFDGNVPSRQTLANMPYSDQLTAPATPGTYEIRLNGGMAASCGTHQAWWQGNPGSTSAIAILCVR